MVHSPQRSQGLLDRLHPLLKALVALSCLYVFLVGIGVMGDAFKIMGKGQSKALLSEASPLVSLFIGILATTLVQSSSTTTSLSSAFRPKTVLAASQHISLDVLLAAGTLDEGHTHAAAAVEAKVANLEAEHASVELTHLASMAHFKKWSFGGSFSVLSKPSEVRVNLVFSINFFQICSSSFLRL